MDPDAVTARSSAYVGGGEATVSSSITFIILLAGVLGGLLIVVCVIIVCKYCLKSKKSQRGSFRGGRHDSGRSIRLLQRYETINSDVFSEPSSVSLDGIPLSPRKPLELRNNGRDVGEEADERTRLCSLHEKDHTYDHTEGDVSVTLADKAPSVHATSKLTAGPAAAREEETGSQDNSGSERRRGGEGFPLETSIKERTEGTPSTSASGSQGQELQGHGGHGSRRVSFQLDNLLHLASNASGSGSNCSNSSRRVSLQSNSRRYTEGDFHYLKHAKIAYGLPRQFSLGTGPLSAPGSRTAPPLCAAAEGAFSYSLDERLRVLLEQADAEDQEAVSFPRRSPIRSTCQPLPASRVGLSGRPARDDPSKHDAYCQFQTDSSLSSPRLGISGSLQPPSSPARLLQQRGLAGRRRSPNSSPSGPSHPVCTKVDVEVHRQQGASPEDIKQGFPAGVAYGLPAPPEPPLHVQRTNAYQKKAASHSLELVGNRRRLPHPTRKVKSYEDFADYDVLQITEFSRGPFYNSDYDVISEMASPTSSMVRYNDTGSLEQLNEETPGESTGLALEALLPPEESDDTDTLNGTYQYRELWQLRATLEEEEECSDTVRMEDMTSPEDSPDREHAHTPHTTSFESTVPSDACGSDQRDSGIQWEKRAAQQQQQEQDQQQQQHHQQQQLQQLYQRPSRYGGFPPPARPLLSDVIAGSEAGVRYPCAAQRQASLCVSCGRRSCGGCRSGGGGSAQQLLHPKYENRRQSYRNLLSGRLPNSSAAAAVTAACAPVPVSTENSFDSVETDGDMSDTSRHEVTTTSFESTTDNTDSTTDSQHSRLRQMKTDSGYKSLETQQSGSREVAEAGDVLAAGEDGRKDVSRLAGLGELPGMGESSSRQQRGVPIALENRRSGSRGGNNGGNGGGAGNSNGHGNGGCGKEAASRQEVAGGRRNSNALLFERRAGRTASKKRREYSRERQVIHVHDSINEPETDSRSDLHSGDSFDDGGQHPPSVHQQFPHHSSSNNGHHHHHHHHHHHSHGHHSHHQHHHHHHAGGAAPSSKRSVFTRFFSQGRDSREKYAVRDYSIDEKTNQIFNEFLRQEGPPQEGCSSSNNNGRLGLRRSPRNQTRPRLQRKHTEPVYEERRRDRLAPEMRSASLGSDSSASSVRKLSPQDSIEEEFEEEEDEAEARWGRTELAPMLEVGGDDDVGVVSADVGPSLLSVKALHDIPIIKLPEEEPQEAS